MNGLDAFPVGRLNEALDGHRCVTAWLGHGSVLFLGFGETVLPIRDQDGRHTKPPYELETNFADWRVDGPSKASTIDSNDVQLLSAAESLIGEKVLNWELLETKKLRVTFTGNKRLQIEGWNEAEEKTDAWSLRSPDRFILAVATDGRFRVVDASLPINCWFRSSSS